MRRNEPPGMPKVIEPQLATLAKQPPAHGDWSYEIKFDGYRMMARLENCDVRLVTRNGYDWTDRMPKLRDALDTLQVHDAWLDGEAVVLNAAGVPDFNALQNAFDRPAKDQILLFLFDALWMNGTDLRASPLRDRRAVLSDLLKTLDSPLVRYSEEFEGDPVSILESARKVKLEGIIGKRTDAPYRSGRSTSWIKLKCEQRQEFVVGGVSRGATDIDSLLLGIFDPDGSLRYVGSVPPYFASRQASAFFRRAEAQENSPFSNTPKPERGREYV